MDESVEVKKERKRGRKAWKWLGLAVVLAVAVGLGIRLTQSHIAVSRLSRLPSAQQNVVIFDEAVRLLKANYFDPGLFKTPQWPAFEASWRKLAAESKPDGWLYANVLGNFALQLPNSHVSFMNPQRAPAPATTQAASKQSKQFVELVMSGPGFDMARIRRGDHTQMVVSDVVQNSPAARAGIAPGWVVDTWGLTSNQAGVRFKGTFVALSPDQSREFDRTATAAAADTPLEFDYEVLPTRTDFETRTLRNGATYLRFDHFNDWGVTNRVLDVLDAAGPGGVVIDLRRNQGGRSLHMSRVLGRLLGGGVTVGAIRSRDTGFALESLKLGGDHYLGPVVVLIGPGTMSAAEITAAAMQDLKRGKLIGRTTCGAVLSARLFSLPDGGSMMIPTSDFARLDDRRIEGIGVEPDIWVLPTLADVRAGRDPVLERAIEELPALR
jgi:carboxyl-terminal processing protease